MRSWAPADSSAVRCVVRVPGAAPKRQTRAVQPKSAKFQQAIRKWQAKQKSLLQALTPSSSSQKPKTSADKEKLTKLGRKAHNSLSVSLSRTTSVHDNADSIEKASLRYKDVSMLLAVLEMPQSFQLTETNDSGCVSLLAILRAGHNLGRA